MTLSQLDRKREWIKGKLIVGIDPSVAGQVHPETSTRLSLLTIVESVANGRVSGNLNALHKLNITNKLDTFKFPCILLLACRLPKNLKFN